ncbi:MAG TPA: MBL fold metallo-hydrolase, partial [Candidatus Dormibacteraeota bacterium]|nr:MBL fold metallo-hydrolase [Candidatus Dormibacteraeota bacterium]
HGRTPESPLIIAGPVGTREYVQRLLLDGYGMHILGLIESEVHPEYVVLQDGSDVELAGYRVRAHAVVHSTGPSLAYALSDAAGATVGFSGDSTLCAGLQRALAGCDAFVCDCTGWNGPVPGGHMWAGEVEQLVRAHPETAFVLSHLDERHELRGAIVAHDLLTLDIAPRTAGS